MLNWHFFPLLSHRKKYVCGTSWLSTWETNLTMSLVTWTSSRLLPPGGTFSANDQPPVIWPAASFRFRLKLSLIADLRQDGLFTLQRRQTPVWWSRLTWEQLWEPASALCLPSQPSCPHLIISMFLCFAATFSSSNDQSNTNYTANCQKHWFNAVTFKGKGVEPFKTECVHLSDLHTV